MAMVEFQDAQTNTFRTAKETRFVLHSLFSQVGCSLPETVNSHSGEFIQITKSPWWAVRSDEWRSVEKT